MFKLETHIKFLQEFSNYLQSSPRIGPKSDREEANTTNQNLPGSIGRVQSPGLVLRVDYLRSRVCLSRGRGWEKGESLRATYRIFAFCWRLVWLRKKAGWSQALWFFFCGLLGTVALNDLLFEGEPSTCSQVEAAEISKTFFWFLGGCCWIRLYYPVGSWSFIGRKGLSSAFSLPGQPPLSS